MSSKGWLLLATGKDTYHRMAFNMAASLRCASQYPVSLLTDGRGLEALSADHRAIFDQIIHVDDKHVKPYGANVNRAEPYYTKAVLNLYTPYDCTMYLDADGICISGSLNEDPTTHQVDELFQAYEGRGFVAHMETGKHFTKAQAEKCPMQWGKLTEIWEYYGFQDDMTFPEINSSMLYFERGSIADDIFTLAEYLYSTWFYEPYAHRIGYYPDELSFNTACTLTYHDPDSHGQPILFDTSKLNWTVDSIRKAGYHFIGLFGGKNFVNPNLWSLYNRLLINRYAPKAMRMTGVKPTYGFKADAGQKAANAPRLRPRYTGLYRFRGNHPASITEIIKRHEYA